MRKRKTDPKEDMQLLLAEQMINPMLMANPEKIVTDPQGSYTGVPMDPREKPVQDADDL